MVFKPGVSGNPAGRRRGVPSRPRPIVPVKTTEEKIRDGVLLAREFMPEGMRILIEIARDKTVAPSERRGAIGMLQDRAVGKPIAPVAVWANKKFTDLTIEDLAEAEAYLTALEATRAVPALIEHQPAEPASEHQDTVAEPVLD